MSLRSQDLHASKSQASRAHCLHITSQVCLFTATMPDSVAGQSKKWLRRAVRCRAEGETAAQAISSTVVQVLFNSQGYRSSGSLFATVRKTSSRWSRTSTQVLTCPLLQGVCHSYHGHWEYAAAPAQVTHCALRPSRWSRCARSTRNRRSCLSTWRPSRRCRRGSATRREPSSSPIGSASSCCWMRWRAYIPNTSAFDA